MLKSAGGAGRLFLSPEGRRMALRRAIEEHSRELSLYGSVSARSGFSGKVGDLISVFKHGGVSPRELEECAQRTDDPLLRQKLSDIAILYDALSGFMAGRYIDSEDAQELLITRMGEAAFLRQTEVFVDLPHSFLYTRQTYRILSRLMELCPAVTVALRLQDEGDEDWRLFTGEARTGSPARHGSGAGYPLHPYSPEAAPGFPPGSRHRSGGALSLPQGPAPGICPARASPSAPRRAGRPRRPQPWSIWTACWSRGPHPRISI